MNYLRRLGQALTSLVVASFIIWAMMGLTPGDPALRLLLGRGVQDPSPAQVAELRRTLNLDAPMPLRYLRWLGGLCTGDLGVSWRTGRPIADELFHRLPSTALLAVVALVIAIVLALAIGVPAAHMRSRWPDHASRGVTLLILAMPSFLIGVVLIDVLTLKLGLGRVVADGTAGTVFLPALTLALGPAASWSRLIRTSLLEAKESTFLHVAHGRGASPWYLLTRHLLPHSAPPLLTVVGLSAAALLGGAPVVETVFSWPGVGLFTVAAIEARDLPVVAAATMLAVLAYVVISFVTDVVIGVIDPRTRQVRS